MYHALIRGQFASFIFDTHTREKPDISIVTGTGIYYTVADYLSEKILLLLKYVLIIARL